MTTDRLARLLDGLSWADVALASGELRVRLAESADPDLRFVSVLVDQAADVARRTAVALLSEQLVSQARAYGDVAARIAELHPAAGDDTGGCPACGTAAPCETSRRLVPLWRQFPDRSPATGEDADG